MRRILLPLCAVLACATAGPKAAQELATAPDFFRVAGVDVKESQPPQFDVRLVADMPTPGWKLAVDEVAGPDAAGRIRVKITGEGPDGRVIQVITPETVRVPLGSLAAGRYLLDVAYRKGKAGAYRRVSALLLDAK